MKLVKVNKNTGEEEVIFEGRINKVEILKDKPKKIDPKWEVERCENQRKAFEFMTSLMILESSIRVYDKGKVWYYLMSLLEENCAESNHHKLYTEIKACIETEREHDEVDEID